MTRSGYEDEARRCCGCGHAEYAPIRRPKLGKGADPSEARLRLRAFADEEAQAPVTDAPPKRRYKRKVAQEAIDAYRARYRRGEATIRQIAEEAGVSNATMGSYITNADRIAAQLAGNADADSPSARALRGRAGAAKRWGSRALTADAATTIRTEHAAGKTYRTLAVKYGVAQTTIRRAVKGEI